MTDLTLFLQYIDTSLPSAKKDVTVFFKFLKENGYIELVFGEEQERSCEGWSVYPHSYPTKVD